MDRLSGLTLESSPSLKGVVDEIVAKEMRRAARKAMRDLRERGELNAALTTHIQATTYIPDQILGDWFPPEPQG